MKIRPEDVAKTTFVIRYGQYEFMVVSFGFTNAPAYFMEELVSEPYLIVGHKLRMGQ
jgi:hypothetical protein